jgi:preprotein translocase subunit SecG
LALPVPANPADRKDHVSTVKILFSILLILTSLALILLVLLHKGKGGGLSDMFGGGVSSSLGGSTIAERNLDRLTVAIGIVWGASIIGLGLITT